MRCSTRSPAEAEAVLEFAPEGHHVVLVVGFGPGEGVELLGERLTTGRVCGDDPSVVMLRSATRRNRAGVEAGNIELVLAPAHDLPWGDDVFDGAVAVNSVPLWDPFDASVAEVARVLTPGARLVSFSHDRAITRNAGSEVEAWVAGVASVCASHNLVEPRLGRGSGGTWVTFSVQKILCEPLGDEQRSLPQACTLGSTDGLARLRRWQELRETAAPIARLAGGQLQVRYRPGPGVWEELRDLVPPSRSAARSSPGRWWTTLVIPSFRSLRQPSHLTQWSPSPPCSGPPASRHEIVRWHARSPRTLR